jgi:hypothetical protein
MDEPLTHLAKFTSFLFERWEGVTMLGSILLWIWYRRSTSPLAGGGRVWVRR